jgi:hypothetical protein
MRSFFYEVVGEDDEDDLTTVSVCDDDTDELFQFSLHGLFKLDTSLGVNALEDAIMERLIQEGDADEDDALEPMGPIEETGEFDDGDEDESADTDPDEWDEDDDGDDSDEWEDE